MITRKFTKEELVCQTSISDGICTLKNINDLDVARRCLKHEQEHMNRNIMINAIKAEIRRQEKKSGGCCPGQSGFGCDRDYIEMIEK